MQCNKSRVGDALGRSLDHIIGRHLHDHRHREAKRLCGLKVDYQLELGRLLDWQVARISPFENLVYVPRRAPKDPIQARTIGNQAARIGEFPEAVDTGKSVVQSKIGELFEMMVHQWIRESNQ